MSFYLLGVLADIPLGTQILGSMGDLIGFRETLILDMVAFATVLLALAISGWWRYLDETPETIEVATPTPSVI